MFVANEAAIVLLRFLYETQECKDAEGIGIGDFLYQKFKQILTLLEQVHGQPFFIIAICAVALVVFSAMAVVFHFIMFII